ncbi:sensor domain-containing diguanylate cyclase [Vibrio cidicii]|uniref:sensor domain-containing diguanylate cyclase n=1 Tax=Vibrio cidicii TaxID=1763883 RepID=UPI003F510989
MSKEEIVQRNLQSMDAKYEKRRVALLHSLKILDTEREERFERFTRLAKFIAGSDIALISLVDSNRQWFKSRAGLDVCQTDRDSSFCTHAIQGSEPLIISDVFDDQRFKDNPLVLHEPFIRAYAGFPIAIDGIHRLGTLCVIDKKPHQLSTEQVQALSDLARILETELKSSGLAIVDELTGLMNRRGFYQEALRILSVSSLSHDGYTLIYFDLDGFKQINDQFGHDVGDEVLRQFSYSLAESICCSQDVACRLGGDEFCALVQHGGHYDVASTIQRLEESLNSQGESGIPPIEYSWGAATRLQHLCGDSVEALLSEADEAMYLCKKQRRKLRQSSVS